MDDDGELLRIGRLARRTGLPVRSRDRVQAMRYAYTHGYAEPASSA
jgi:hypothetical protein